MYGVRSRAIASVTHCHCRLIDIDSLVLHSAVEPYIPPTHHDLLHIVLRVLVPEATEKGLDGLRCQIDDMVYFSLIDRVRWSQNNVVTPFAVSGARSRVQ